LTLVGHEELTLGRVYDIIEFLVLFATRLLKLWIDERL
jgi:hypothetical protein